MSILVFLFLFSLLDGLPAILMVIPIFVPIGKQLGIDPLHYGIIMTAITGIALFSPRGARPLRGCEHCRNHCDPGRESSASLSGHDVPGDAAHRLRTVDHVRGSPATGILTIS